MEELTTNVNWLAVIIGFVASFLLGWLWYSPRLFGTKWAEGAGVDLGAAGEMPVTAMVMQAIGTFLLSWIVGITASNEALAIMILIAVTFATLQIAGGHYLKHSNYTIMTNAGFTIAMVVVMVVVQGIF